MSYPTWRDRARPIIADVIAEVGRDDMKNLRAALREAYPFGERKYYPYKIWLSEIKRQLRGDKIKGQNPLPSCRGQMDLFDGGTE